MFRKTPNKTLPSTAGAPLAGVTEDDLVEIQQAYEQITHGLNQERSRGEGRILPTPARVANHRFLALDSGAPRFSVAQVEFALQSPPPAQSIDATQWSIEITPVQGASVKADATTVVQPTKDCNSGRLESVQSCLVQILSVTVDAGDDILHVPITVSATTSVEEVKAKLQSHCGDGYLTFTNPNTGQKTLIVDDDILQEVIRNQWVCAFRTDTGRTFRQPPRRPLESLDEPTADQVVRRLFTSDDPNTPDKELLDLTDRVSKLHAYELNLQRSIRELVAAALAKQPLGKPFPIQARMVSELVKTLTILTQRWEAIEGTAKERRDAVKIEKRLHWFLAAILDHMDPELTKKWATQTKPALRLVESYSSWGQFKHVVFGLMACDISSHPEDLLRDLPALMGPISDYSDISIFVATLNDYRIAGHEFVRLRNAPEANIIIVDKYVLRYVVDALSATAIDALQVEPAGFSDCRATADRVFRAASHF